MGVAKMNGLSFQSFFQKIPFTLTVISLNLLCYIVLILPGIPRLIIFEKLLGSNLSISAGEWWRIITSVFLHAGFEHFLFNSLSLFLFGTLLESILPKAWLIISYFTSAIIGNFLTWVIGPEDYIHVGSSGAIFGLIGIITIFIFTNKFGERLTESFKLILPLMVILNFLQPKVNPYSHLGGLLAGIVLGLFLLNTNSLKKERPF